MRPTQIAQPTPDVVQYRSRDGDDWRRRHGFYRRGNEAYYNGHRGYYERRRGYRTGCGFHWPRLPPARLLAERWPSVRSVTGAAMWNGAQTGTAATGLTTTLISQPTAHGANATLPIKRQRYRNTVERAGGNFGLEEVESAGPLDCRSGRWGRAVFIRIISTAGVIKPGIGVDIAHIFLNAKINHLSEPQAFDDATDTRTVRFLFLPPEHDPDSYVRESGAEAFQRCIDEAVPLSRQLTEQARDGAELDSAEARSRMLSNARPLWSTLPEGMLRRQLLSELAEAGGVPVDVLAGMWGAEGRRTSPRDETQASPPRGRGSPRRAAPRTATLLDRAAWLLVCHPELWSSVSHEQHEMLAHQPSPYADFFARLERHLNEHGPGSPEALVQDMAAEDLGPEGPTLLARIADFHANGPDVDPHKDLTILMDQLLLGAIKDEMNLLVESGLAEPEMAERYRELGRRQADLTKRLSASPGS